MTNKSGLADSPFFVKPESTAQEPTSSGKDTSTLPIIEKNKASLPNTSTQQKAHPHGKRVTNKNEDITSTQKVQPKPEDEETMIASVQANKSASMQASMHVLIQEDIIEIIRKAVKNVGKDSATYRFTPEEKKALLELSFSFKMQGYKTSENELTRIAINFLIEDQKQNGRNSILQRVLDALSK